MESYSPVGDIITMGLTILFAILLNSAYTVKYKNLTIFRIGEVSLALAAVCDVQYHILFRRYLTPDMVPLIYLFRNLAYILMSLVNVLFIIYLVNLFGIAKKNRRIYLTLIGASFILYVIFQCLESVLRFGFYIDENLELHQNLDPFAIIYLFLLANLIGLFIRYRKKLVHRMTVTLIRTTILALVVAVVQIVFRQTSFTTFSYAIPLISVLFLFHYNAYDIVTGMLDAKSFPDYVADQKKKGKKFGMVWLRLLDVSVEQLLSLTDEFYHFTGRFFHNPTLFRMRDDKMVMVYEYHSEADRDARMVKMLESYGQLYDKFRIDFKIILMDDTPLLATGEDFMGLSVYMEKRMGDNEVRTSNDRDIAGYRESRVILDNLRDIHLKGNLDDERVLVYCQPVLNTENETFCNAEALMRLKIPGYGIVQPDDFIPLAEKNGYIHDLTKIILYKVCVTMKSLLNRGYLLDCVSINVSITEFRMPRFAEDIKDIIRDTGLGFDYIALELTETKNETDFVFVRSVMQELKEVGIHFYLDDFGTGYSNYDRILGLPIDIIKFDRSMTRMASADRRTRYLVGSFSHIFRDCGYHVLFEGVEDVEDEEICGEMEALYLQGFKYSKPVPIDELPDFLERDGY
jgi:EAL domain-containing protein (putative c-di-GMP-specific phosphodiesterase class I)